MEKEKVLQGSFRFKYWMKIVYHEKFEDSSYALDPAAEKGRMKCIMEELRKETDLDIVKAETAELKDLRSVHTSEHIEGIKEDEELFEMASLAAGGSIKAAQIALEGEPSFAVVRPPGHHASPSSHWGFCYFNNMGIAIEKLRALNEIERAFILDFDLHRGDGNINSIGDRDGVRILNPLSDKRKDYLEEVKRELDNSTDYDIIGASAGFDEHVEDWGGKLKTEDYREIGKIMKESSERICDGKRFALLEGGYKQKVLGKNARAFVDGFRDRSDDDPRSIKV